MTELRIFMDTKKNYCVVGDYFCSDCNNKIDDWGIINCNFKSYTNIYCDACVKKPKYGELIRLSRQEKVGLDQYFLVVVANNVEMDWVYIVPKFPSMVNGDSISVFDVDKIDKKYPSQTIDKTRFAGRESLDDTALIGSPDMQRLEDLDKPLDDVDGLLDDIMNSKVVVSESNIKMIGSDENKKRGDDRNVE